MGVSAHCLSGVSGHRTCFSLLKWCEKYKSAKSTEAWDWDFLPACTPFGPFFADLCHYFWNACLSPFCNSDLIHIFRHSTASSTSLVPLIFIGFIRISSLSHWWSIRWFLLLACYFKVLVECLYRDMLKYGYHSFHIHCHSKPTKWRCYCLHFSNQETEV